MRIPIREQIGLIILGTSLICLGVVSIATWVTERSFVLENISTRLSLTASLKAAQLTSNLDLMQTVVQFLSTRVLIQRALQRYASNGNNTAANWVQAQPDLQAAIGGAGSLGSSLALQAMVFPASATGPAGVSGLLNATASEATVQLPYDCPDGTPVDLGDACGNNLGYPPNLYPNLTYTNEYYNSTLSTAAAIYAGDTLGLVSTLVLGPWAVNDTFSLMSMTMPIINNTSAVDVLGWLTVIMDATLILQVVRQGVDVTGQTLLIGPVNPTNLFPDNVLNSTTSGGAVNDFSVQFVVPLNTSDASRHPDKTVGTANAPFNASQYPAVQTAFTQASGQSYNSGAIVKASNEAGLQISVGYALPQTNMVNWAILVEEARSEVWQPIDHLRNLLLACVFGTAGFMVLIAFPFAHIFSLPIRRLREATMKSIEPPGVSRSSLDSFASEHDGARDLEEAGNADGSAIARKEGFRNPITVWRRRRKESRESRGDRRRKQEFRIPGKVKEHKHFVKDELSDLTFTFNEMSDELMMQYERLEERVQQRTAELELSKKAAEAANESKTLFIANISHELKTPLNGILGMCAVCMQEDDPTRIKRSLGIIYKSGDLLLNLLQDLLTFTRGQAGQGQHLTLDEKEFRLRDVSSQILAIFDKQAKEGGIDLRVEWEGAHRLENDDSSPERKERADDSGRIRDMILWGDVHRVLQVIINLTSNALKFTPAGGSVVLTIRCSPEVVPELGSRQGSFQSRQSRPSRQQSSMHKGSDATLSHSRPGVANGSPSKDKSTLLANLMINERAPSPPPGRYRTFDFEVCDTGPGIPEDSQAKIFEPFVQGDLGLSKKYGGTGLGLSICQQLAKLMRGTIGVKSTVGAGSTFTMSIPIRHLQSRADSSASSVIDGPAKDGVPDPSAAELAERTPARHSRHLTDDHVDNAKSKSSGPLTVPLPVVNTDSQPRLVGLSQPFFASSEPLESPDSQPAAMQKMTAEASRGGKIRVLVAEDNKVNQEVVLRMLKLEDIYDVTVAKDGQEALDIVKQSMDGPESRPFNLIFMDVQMPNVDGLQSTRLIREIGYQAPIVALTAFAEESNIKECIDSGMNYFLSKPIRRPQLKKVLKEYCAPIPEESEEVTPPAEVLKPAPSAGSTSIAMVNSPPLANGLADGQATS